MDNLSWSNKHILNSCEDPLRDKIQEGLVGVSELELGGPLVLQLMCDDVMDIEDSSLRSHVESLQMI